MISRRNALASTIAGGALAALPLGQAQTRRETLVLAMALEPAPGLDPTAGAASAIGEITLYNLFETLTKINSDGTVSPLLAESWEVSPDLKTYTFKLRRGVKFHNGEAFNAAAVKFSFERAGTDKSVNKDKRTFASMYSVAAIDEHTVVILNTQLDPDFLFLMGQATAVIVEPKSADSNATKPVGTGPYQFEAWNKGASVVLSKWNGYRQAAAVRIKKVTFRFISDPAAQVAALNADRQRMADSISGAAATVGKNLAGSAKVEMPGPGGQAYAPYGSYLGAFYKERWRKPSSITARSAYVGVEIDVARDGRVVDMRMEEKSGHRALDDSVRDVIQRYKQLRPLPDGTTDAKRTFRIKFTLEADSNT